jgi:hypothetical protein
VTTLTSADVRLSVGQIPAVLFASYPLISASRRLGPEACQNANPRLLPVARHPARGDRLVYWVQVNSWERLPGSTIRRPALRTTQPYRHSDLTELVLGLSLLVDNSALRLTGPDNSHTRPAFVAW